jgi:hypothetical protein
MSSSNISLLLRQQIIAEFHGRCAYCHTPTAITGARLVIDHIIPEAKGGLTLLQNLCLACHACNEFKGAKVNFTDVYSGELVPLFHPRQQIWREPFSWSEEGCEIIGLTPIGWATIIALNMNYVEIVEARRRWVVVGWHPPLEDL